MLKYNIEVGKFGRLILEETQRISVGCEPDNVDVLKQYIVPEQKWIEYAQDLTSYHFETNITLGRYVGQIVRK